MSNRDEHDQHDETGTPDGPDAHEEALAELLGSSLLAGPDPSIVADVKASDDVAAAEADAIAEAEVAEIYRDILTRNPEHDFDPTIDRVRRACELLDDPQRSAPVVHITGTNGKTSTARMVEALLAEQNLRVGRFTSPHLHNVRERITIDSEPISAAAFVEAYREIEPIIGLVDDESQASGGPRLSFFEVFTLMAFAAFASAPVDVIVLEVGMGGRFDATNVADAAVAVITPIARDHERYLGNELTDIAGEKAGIIKPGCEVVMAAQRDEVAGVIYAAAAQAGARLVAEGEHLSVVDRQVAVGGQFATLATTAATYTDVLISLHGAHQAHNALLALAAVEALFGGRALSGEVVERAMMAVTSPGRLEVVRSSPTVVVDAAHNPHGVAATVATLEETFGFTRLVAVVGVLADKNVEAMLVELEPHVEAVVLTQVMSERALNVAELAEVATDVFGEDRTEVAASLGDAIERAATLAEAEGGPAATTGVLVIGSVYLAAAAREILGKRKV
ncbi:bifunctional folylpolyglutamate synthase/dihydrofolate synthase [Bowdeniella nasicola]|uniref:bifunctional folylpolyglutamate synthase/dihydrofolate synthase n=1 Tax=Bowdeniella nasicola TaxID=208480 RepID=UPI0009F921D5|nr:folylpolyglutamate synthase/dihydrofolate synthase family protein [Bowdeniella nasicola]